ncbi:MAG: hypothetical protein P8Z78_03140 [Gammaproteobacteria bacterium]|jgi:hypothetical protein
MSPRNILFGLLGAAMTFSLLPAAVSAGEEAQQDPAAAPENASATGQPAGTPETKTTRKQIDTTIPVTGAFGIELGSAFDPAQVKRVIAEEEQSYRGTDKTEYSGRLYEVEPVRPDEHFSSYQLSTTAEGVVYEIRADFEDPIKRNLCKQTKQIADALTETYGKPRGKGILGEWYTFRDMRAERYRGIRFYAPKCRVGRYSIIYRDDNLLPAANASAD